MFTGVYAYLGATHNPNHLFRVLAPLYRTNIDSSLPQADSDTENSLPFTSLYHNPQYGLRLPMSGAPVPNICMFSLHFQFR